MPGKKLNGPKHPTKDFIDQKIQYGESQNKCFACGEKIKIGTKICPYCHTKQDKIK